MTENNPSPNFVGSPKKDCQSSGELNFLAI